jgi:Zn-finger nucleic acid-binding protein
MNSGPLLQSDTIRPLSQESQFVKCPVCVEPHLVIAERQGIEVDYCPSCRGVWLDRGELDKLIEKSSAVTAPAPRAPGYDQRGQAPQQYYKKQKSWLHEIFD